jgi:hypothetical protein
MPRACKRLIVLGLGAMLLAAVGCGAAHHRYFFSTKGGAQRGGLIDLDLRSDGGLER